MGQRYNFSITTVIGNVDAPTLGSDAATKAYVDSRPSSGGTVTLVSSTINAFNFGGNANVTPALTITNASSPSTQFLKADGTWAVPPSNPGTVTQVTSAVSGFTYTNQNSTPALTIQNASSPSTQYLKADGTWQTAVTSIGMTVPTGFAVTGPITTNGSLALTYSGLIPVTSLGTGAPSAATYLRGDQVWSPVLMAATVNGGAPGIVGTINFINGTNTTVVRAGNNVSVNVAGIGTGTVTQVTSSLTAFSFGANQTTTPQLTVVGGSTSTFLRGDGTWQTAVTSVDMTVPTGFAIGGRPITGSGTLALTYSGLIPATSLGTSPTSSNFLRGDQTWQPILISAQVSGQTAITGALTLTAGSNVTLTQSGNTITINSTATGGNETGIWFSGVGAPTTVAGAALGNYYWDTASLNSYLMTNLVGATQTWTAQPNLDSYVRLNADGRIALNIGSLPTPPGIEFTSTNTTTGTYVPGVFPVDQPFSNLVAALLAIGDGIVQNPTGDWTLPANPILISITQNPTATQYTRITQITQSALEINLVVDTMNQAYFSGSTYPQTLYIVSQRFSFQTSPQLEVLRLARTVVPAGSGQNFAIRDDVTFACRDVNNNTFAGIVTSDRATATIVFAQAVADGTTVSNIGITFTSSIPSSFVNGISIVTFSNPSLFNITLSVLSVSGSTYTLTGELNTVNNTSVPAGTYTVIVTRAAKAQTLQGLVGNVNLTSQNSSVAISVTGQNIDLAATGSGGGASSTNFEQIFQVLGGAFPTSITTWGGVDSSEPYGYAVLPITDYTGGQINNLQYFQPANYVNPYGQPLTLPRAIGGSTAPYSNFTTRMVMPTLNNVSMTLDVVPPSTGWVVNVWFTRVEAVNNGDTAFLRANIMPFMQAYNTGSDGPNNVPVQAPILATPTITGNTITWPTINPGLWVGSVPAFGFNPSVLGSNQQYVPVFYITHNSFPTNTVTSFTVGSISGQGYYEMDLSLGTANSPNTSLQQAVNIGNSITNAGLNVGTIQISDALANPARTSILAGSSITTPNLVLPGVTSGSLTLTAPATITPYSVVLPASQSADPNNILYVNNSGISSFSLPTIALQVPAQPWNSTAFSLNTAVAAGTSVLTVNGDATSPLTGFTANGFLSFTSLGSPFYVVASAVYNGTTQTTITLQSPLLSQFAVGAGLFRTVPSNTQRFNAIQPGGGFNSTYSNGVLYISAVGGGGGGGGTPTLDQVTAEGAVSSRAITIQAPTGNGFALNPSLNGTPQFNVVGTGNVDYAANALGSGSFLWSNANNRLRVALSGTNVTVSLSPISGASASLTLTATTSSSSITLGTDVVLTPQIAGNIYLLGLQLETNLSQQPKVAIAASQGSTNLGFGTAGQVFTSGGNASAPYWTTPATPIQTSILTWLPSGSFNQGPYQVTSASFVLNQLGLTVSTSGLITGWVNNAVYRLTLTMGVLTSAAANSVFYASFIQSNGIATSAQYPLGVAMSIVRTSNIPGTDVTTITGVGYYSTSNSSPLYGWVYGSQTTFTVNNFQLTITRVT